MATQQPLTAGEVRDVSLESRMEQAFLDYSMSVIVGRALPDVRDGLKPVQRRILYSMWESGLHPDRPFRKCASAVGEVMKTYHPHGDTSIYDALVRMAQDFATREPLVDGHGNFGSIDGDPPAAMRYTEARLSPVALELLSGIDEDTVNEIENYDGYATEPVVLPARFPNLLVNGSSGIAVGMATSIPPHNLGEVIDACLLLIRKPEAALQELMRHVPAPDFPGGARIISSDGITQAYASGRGAVTVEAVATTETRSGNLPRIIITEIPYQVNKASLLERMADLVAKRKLDAVRDLRDESSRDGMRIVIELKRGEDPSTVLATLYDQTDLRTKFNVNLVALVDGAPQTLGLRDVLTHYVAHQREVVTRRTEHRLARANARLHILDGLLRAIDQLDAVIALIRRSASASEAKQGLIDAFDLTEIQAQAVLDMQLRRLAALERQALIDEHQQLLDTISSLEAILNDRSVLDAVIVAELNEIKRIHATPRRSVLVGASDEFDAPLASGARGGFAAQDITAFVTAGGYVKTIAQRRTSPPHNHGHDPLVAVVRAATDDTLLLVERGGMGHRVSLSDIPVVRANQRGTHVGGLLGGGPDMPLAGAVILPQDDQVTVLTVTATGMVKRTAVAEFRDGRQRSVQAVNIRDNDAVVAVLLCRDADEVILASDAGAVTRFSLTHVRAMGRNATGVAGMKLDNSAAIVAASIIPDGSDEGEVITLASDGTVKRSPLADYPAKGRGGKGVTAGVAAPLLWCGTAGDIHVGGEEPVVVRPVDIAEARRTARGVALDHPVAAPVVCEQTFGD